VSWTFPGVAHQLKAAAAFQALPLLVTGSSSKQQQQQQQY
jgi:hypothetical protein